MAPRHLKLLALIAWLALAGLGRAADGQVYYFAERTFEIPFNTDPSTPHSRIHLHASTDEGKTYTDVGSTTDARGAFTYTARADGWYFFVVQIENKDGSFTPANVRMTQPSLRVCVDTEKPKVALRQVKPQKGGSVAVEWTITDLSLDLQTLRVEYRVVNAARWLPIRHDQVVAAQLEWNPPSEGPFEVRLLVGDKAKHQAEAKLEVAGTPGSGGFSRAPGAESLPTGGRPPIFVNKKTFKLNYKIEGAGPSNIKQVEVWTTRDTSTWTRMKDNVAPAGPCEITVPMSGRHGFTLRPISGVGRGGPAPKARDLPQVWVEVDEAVPVVSVHSVVVNEGEDRNTITVNWVATDKFFGDTPITISYAPTNGPDANWQPLQASVENTGSHKCRCPERTHEFFVRVEAVDRAGNKASAQTRELVKVDLSEPKATDINVTIGDASQKPPM